MATLTPIIHQPVFSTSIIIKIGATFINLLFKQLIISFL
jgi:hypothetical protein